MESSSTPCAPNDCSAAQATTRGGRPSGRPFREKDGVIDDVEACTRSEALRLYVAPSTERVRERFAEPLQIYAEPSTDKPYLSRGSGSTLGERAQRALESFSKRCVNSKGAVASCVRSLRGSGVTTALLLDTAGGSSVG